MNVWDYLDNSNFAGLAVFSLEDIIEVVKHYDSFVLPELYQAFTKEKENAIGKANKDLETLLPMARAKYEEAISNNDIPDEDPELVEAKINGRLRNDLINIIKKFFAQNVFAVSKWSLPNYKSNEKKAIIDTNDLAIALVPIRNQLYTFLSVVGHYQYRKHYFLSQDDWREMNYIYSKDAAKVNEPLGFKYKPLSLFLKDKRINPGIDRPKKEKKVEGNKEAVKELVEVNKEKQSRQPKYLDVDKISLEELILKYCKTNIEQLIKIAQIIRNTFDHSTEDNFEVIKDECNEYIELCEAKKLMVKL